MSIPKPVEVRKLIMGDEMTVYDETIVVGCTGCYFKDGVKQEHVDFVLSVYAQGAAAQGRMIHMAWRSFMDSMKPVNIVATKEEETIWEE